MPHPLPEMIEDLIRAHDTCVLSTMGPDGPHASLMSYAPAPDAGSLFLITARQTRKFRNMIFCPRVSILIDTRREDRPGEEKALTLSGVACPLAQDEAQAARASLLSRHPRLAEFTDTPDTVCLEVSFRSAQLLTGVQEAAHMTFNPPDASAVIP